MNDYECIVSPRDEDPHIFFFAGGGMKPAASEKVRKGKI
jgi:hypothetical protein